MRRARQATCVLPTPYRLRCVRPRTQLRHAAAVRVGTQPGPLCACRHVAPGARSPRRFGHQDGSARRWVARTPWQERARDRRPALRLHAQDAVPLDLPRGSRFQAGRDCRFPWEVRGQEARRPPPGQWSRPPVLPPEALCYVPSPHLLFQAVPGGTALLFTCERGGLLPPRVIPVRKVYFVSNAVTMVRLPERTPLPVRSVEISVDAESWSWGFSAGLAASALRRGRADRRRSGRDRGHRQWRGVGVAGRRLCAAPRVRPRQPDHSRPVAVGVSGGTLCAGALVDAGHVLHRAAAGRRGTRARWDRQQGSR